MPATDLWPDFHIDSKPRGVRQILEEAGEGLKEKTGGLVEFRVWPDEERDREFPIRYRCDLYVQKMDYNFPLLAVHASPTGFPVKVVTGAGVPEAPLKAGDESSLHAVLASIFRSDYTKAVVRNLISMATE
jgi:hypothetical protein